jgi:hypothetical protein
LIRERRLVFCTTLSAFAAVPFSAPDRTDGHRYSDGEDHSKYRELDEFGGRHDMLHYKDLSVEIFSLPNHVVPISNW